MAQAPLFAAIETRHLTRRFGKVTAVEGLNLQVPAGTLFGLIGPNGAGKTTTLRLLAGLLEPSSGEILINGQVANHDWQALRLQIGYMPDFFGVYEDMLVWEYLDFFARCYRLPTERRRQVTDELLELVDLADQRDAYVQTLSRGMRQRLCLAHALVHDPQVLLLDEPASGLDPRARVEMRELLRELGAMGKTVIVSSHILSEMAELCDAVGIIERGRLVASGSLDEITRHVRHRDGSGLPGAQGTLQAHTLRLQTLSDPELAVAVLGDQPGTGQIREVNGFLEVEFEGDAPAMARLLATLVAQGIPIVSFGQVTNDLEEIFLRLTTAEGGEQE